MTDALERERRDLHDTAVRLGRWQGGVDQRLQEHSEDIRSLNALVTRLTWALVTFSLTVAGSAATVALTVASG